MNITISTAALAEYTIELARAVEERRALGKQPHPPPAAEKPRTLDLRDLTIGECLDALFQWKDANRKALSAEARTQIDNAIGAVYALLSPEGKAAR